MRALQRVLPFQSQCNRTWARAGRTFAVVRSCFVEPRACGTVWCRLTGCRQWLSQQKRPTVEVLNVACGQSVDNEWC